MAWYTTQPEAAPFRKSIVILPKFISCEKQNRHSAFSSVLRYYLSLDVHHFRQRTATGY